MMNRQEEAQWWMERCEANINTILYNIVICEDTECDINKNYAKSMLKRLQKELDGFKKETKIKYEL